jgi:RNA-directed DNA polymerase
MSLATPEKIRTLQRKLYRKAKAEPTFRFYLLYDKVHRDDILEHAYALARSNGGAPGVDGESFAAIEALGLGEWLAGIRKELLTKTYRPAPVRRVMIPKPGGGERPLGIPTIRDRVVQTATKLVLEPIFEADLDPATYGYRPGRSGIDAIKAVHALLCRGFTDVVDADLSRYFDTIPHRELMRSVARRIVDRHVLRLIKLWLRAPVEECGDDGRRRMTGGKGSRYGTPQGGVISPLLANLYMNRFLKHWRRTGRGEAYRAHVIAYADDFVILSRGCADEALAWTRGVMTRLGLTLNEAKTAVRDVRRERFAFLGYTFGPHHYRKDGHWSGGEPVEEERAAAQGEGQRSAGARQHERLARGARPAQPPVAGLVGVLRLRHPPAGVPGDRQPRLRSGPPLPGSAPQGALARHQSLPAGGGIRRARGAPPQARTLGTAAVCLAMKPVGKPDAGNPHVRFDERGGETEPRRAGLRRRSERTANSHRQPTATASLLDSTRE